MLPLAILLSALLAIAGDATVLDVRPLLLLFKPLATALILLFAARRGGDPRIRRALLAGLAFSWLGDVALMFPHGFEAGLGAFLMAHLAYLFAFTRDARPMARLWPFVAYAFVSGAVLALLWPGLPVALKLPVAGYVLALAAMAAQALARWRVLSDPLAGRAALGSACFVLSDALLAFDRFDAPIPLAGAWVLASYWLAQSLIASSLPRR